MIGLASGRTQLLMRLFSPVPPASAPAGSAGRYRELAGSRVVSWHGLSLLPT